MIDVCDHGIKKTRYDRCSRPPSRIEPSMRVCIQLIRAAFGLSSKMIIRDVVVKKTIFKPEHQKTFRAIPERVCEVFPKK